jgi:hypothetical protein
LELEIQRIKRKSCFLVGTVKVQIAFNICKIKKDKIYSHAKTRITRTVWEDKNFLLRDLKNHQNDITQTSFFNNAGYFL